MLWESTKNRLALLELLVDGRLKRRQSQAEVFKHLSELPWTRATGRKDELKLDEDRRADLVQLLEQVWPEWREASTDFLTEGWSPTPKNYVRLLDRQRAQTVPKLPERINRRTAAALVAPNSKATLTEPRRTALRGAEPTHDGLVRLRPVDGLSAKSPQGTIDLTPVGQMFGEIAIPERAFLNDVSLAGSVRALVLIENLGAWRDFPVVQGCLFSHVPGWDTATVTHLLRQFDGVPVVHFGDIDPNGVRIFFHLQERVPNLLWFVPEVWRFYIDTHALQVEWPRELPLNGTPQLVRDLAVRGLWLEQERVVLDPQIGSALEELLNGS